MGINLTKKVKDFYNKSYKTLKKEFKEGTTGWKDFSFSWIIRINTVKICVL